MLIRAKGQMYPWIDCLINYFTGGCPHACEYCYVAKMGERFPAVREKYTGCLRLLEKELKENLYKFGKGVSIFPQNNGDVCAAEVPTEWILKILEHCNAYPKNTYLFQSKNPRRFLDFVAALPDNAILGTTIETNADLGITKAPNPRDRFLAMLELGSYANKMVSIEPIMDFDLETMVEWMKQIRPKFVSVGADSKNCNLPEPPDWKVKKLIDELMKFTEVRVKPNIARILEGYHV